MANGLERTGLATELKFLVCMVSKVFCEAVYGVGVSLYEDLISLEAWLISSLSERCHCIWFVFGRRFGRVTADHAEIAFRDRRS